jgi:hypothetical protein
VYGAFLIPEYAVAALLLCNHPTFSRSLAVLLFKPVRITPDVPGDGGDLCGRHVGPSISPAAVSAHPAGEDVVWFHENRFTLSFQVPGLMFQVSGEKTLFRRHLKLET